MAQVTITIIDDEDGGVNVKLEANPAITGGVAGIAPAHFYGLAALDAITEAGEVMGVRANGEDVL